MDFIVAAKKEIEVECLYYGYKKEDIVTNKKTLSFGDRLTVENKGRYIVDVGWFVLITINNRGKEYMSASDLEEYIHANEVVSPIDCMLEYFNLSYQLDKALENRDKTTFLKLSERKKEVSAIYDMINEKTIIHS